MDYFLLTADGLQKKEEIIGKMFDDDDIFKDEFSVSTDPPPPQPSLAAIEQPVWTSIHQNQAAAPTSGVPTSGVFPPVDAFGDDPFGDAEPTITGEVGTL